MSQIEYQFSGRQLDHVADANLFSWYSCGMWYLCRAKKLTSIYHHHLSILVPPSWAVGTTCFLSLTSINQHFTIQSFFTIIFQTIYHLFLSQPLPSTLLVTCYSSLMTYPYHANLPYFYGVTLLSDFLWILSWIRWQIREVIIN